MASSLEPRLLVGAHDGDLSDGDPSSVEESLSLLPLSSKSA